MENVTDLPVRLTSYDYTGSPTEPQEETTDPAEKKQEFILTRGQVIACCFLVFLIAFSCLAAGILLGVFIQVHSISVSPIDGGDAICTFTNRVSGSLYLHVEDSRLRLVKGDTWNATSDGYFILVMFASGNPRCSNSGDPFPFQYNSDSSKLPTAIVTNITITEWTSSAVNFTFLPFDNKLIPEKNFLGRSLHIFSRETKIERAIESGNASKLPDPLACCLIARPVSLIREEMTIRFPSDSQ